MPSRCPPLLDRRSAACAIAVLAAGCATPTLPPRPSVPAPATPTPYGAPGSDPLAVEQRWLQDWFRGTPVAIDRDSAGAVRVEVPQRFCFDPGRSDVKPPLAAVLDRVATSLRRQASARVELAAPSPAGADALADQRAGRLRDHLRRQGVAVSRISATRVAQDDAVRLRLVPGS